MSKFISALIALAALWFLAMSCEARGQEDDRVRAAYKTAYDKQHPIVVWVQVDQRKIVGAVSVQVYEHNLYKDPCILVGKPGDAFFTQLPITATDADISAAAFPVTKAVSLPAAPFDQYNTPRQQRSAAREGDPWLSREETDKIKAKWPKGVEWNPNVKWYRLAPLYQEMFTMNNGRSKFNVPTSISSIETRELSVSGGMANVHNFTSIKGIDFDNKKVIVWQENADVRAFSLVPMWRWQFVPGMKVFDMLLNGDGDLFELRQQTRAPERQWETDILFKDVAARPSGYSGLKQSCASCHSQTPAMVNVGRGYLYARWGDDGRYSWRPFDEAGNLDRRWPIELQ